ncbi:multiple sugar transport system ATP-binding protein [Silvimonas terrae]|uniref:Multiple sugar transport system ATP-binding protein n=1 Tax=Silvimonas terrae TaxID=300266 RepID=A0A840RBX7_9NEIS|nr:sn-glycerol-3-phosphate ABC transporter ATP-binding protein UgpC [Silvimonas terrae]MBB5189801.1 multiple sugar transport system ATP-binding protein [Silvimonas terrae]
MASVTLHQVKKSYGDTAIIHGVDLAIADGEFVVLVGPSGCGKSTLLRMLAGLEEISGGQIRIGNRVVNGLPPRDRDIAMVFQNYALYPHMTVGENMTFALRLKKQPEDEIKRRLDQAAAMLGLSHLLERFPRQLSGGQRQRVAMGRAIVRDPQVFLFDEPLSNLDAKLRVQMRADIKALHQQLKTTSVYVTHDQIEAMTMADRIVVLHDGLIEQVGTPLELYDNPANKFVAGFIGSPSMNFLPGTLRHAAGGTVIDLEDGQHWQVSAQEIGAVGQKVWLGLRPEHLQVIDGHGLNATVRVIEPTGADTHLIMKLGQTELCATVRDRISAAAGQVLQLSPQPGKAYLFDHATEARIALTAEAAAPEVVQ